MTDKSPGPVARAISDKLTQAFAPVELKIDDDSHRHAGHMGYRGDDGETHFNVAIRSAHFNQMNRVARQRAVYQVLAEELAGPVHALALKVEGTQ